jgi:hypothetical protein
MALGESINKMKIAELRKLAKDLNIESSGNKKADYLTALYEAVERRIEPCTVSDLKSLAKELSINLRGKKKKKDVIEAIYLSITPKTIGTLLGAVPSEESLEDIGEELVEIEKDVEVVIDAVEKIPSADMADIYVIDKKLADIINLNVDYSNVGSLLDVGRVKFMDKRYVESISMLHEATKASKDFYDEYQDVTYAFMILAAEKVLEECREAKSNDEKAADALIDAKRAFSERGPHRAEATKLLNDIAVKVYKEELELLEDLMNKRESMIKAMKIQGVDIFNAERYLHRAREVFLVGELRECTTYLEKSENIASESKDSWIKEIEEDVPRVEGIIKQATEFGAETSEAEKHLNHAKTALDNEDYSLCSELTKLAERKAMEGQQGQIQKAALLEQEKLGDAQKILATISPLVQEAKLYSLDVREVDNSVNSSMAALQNNDYVNALTYARQAENQAKYLKTKVEAEREKILASEDDLKTCSICIATAVKVFDNGWARCMSCGQTFEVKGDKKKKKWGLFGK